MRNGLKKSATIYKPEGHLDPAGFQRNILFETYLPPDNLQSFIHHFWTISWNRATGQPYTSEQVMHRPYVDVYMSKQESGIQCSFRDRRDYEAVDNGRIIGARFLPGAFRTIWRGTMAGLHNQTISLQLVFAEADQSFIEDTLSLEDDEAVGVLADLIQAHNPQYDPNIGIINKIIDAIETDDLQTVSDIAEWFGKSERWLQQLFQEYVGIGIKWQLQRNKLLRAAKCIRDNDNTDWADLAYDMGYSSQQHFITDFKRVLGKTPLQYKKELSIHSQK
ncbi:helix-turn-helix domain-containing protein [Paenibacillus harenae]|uniref:helix-turn-helix domain-containing protein n=1 Tax=Paenibacillus harenae TaxID=306543 RepID=UPI001FDFAE18|nr:AraC family transcriptional regulator [Paenibacillus harenae]